MSPAFRHRWFELCNREGISAKMDMWNALCDMYGEENRTYHNLLHVEDCLNKLDAWPEDVPEKTAVEVALWFHDIIYDPKRTDNELASAGLVKHYLGDHELAEPVFELILATRHHASTMTEAEYILCDIDLSTLGSDEKTYDAYSKAVRKEFSWVPEEMFCSSRIKVLESFIERDFIFYTEHYREKYEGYARANIIREISLLKRQLRTFEKS